MPSVLDDVLEIHGKMIPPRVGNDRDLLWGAYDRSLDATVYLRNALVELGDDPEPAPYAVALKSRYGQSLRMLVGIHELISLRVEGGSS